MTLETIEPEFPYLSPSLVDHDGVGFMLVRSAQFGPVVLGRDGLHRLATGVVIGDDPLADYGPHAAELIRRVDTLHIAPTSWSTAVTTRPPTRHRRSRPT